MTTTQIIPAFDYATLDAETRIVVQQEDKEFDRNVDDAGNHFIRACHNLKRIHVALKYKRPGFVDYCRSKSGLSERTAYRMLDVAKMFAESANIPAESKEAFYLLAAASVPESARQEAIARAQDEPLTRTTAKQIVLKGLPSPISDKVIDQLPADPVGITEDLTPSPDTADAPAIAFDSWPHPDLKGDWVTQDGEILRYHPESERAWCAQCAEYRDFRPSGAGQDVWACKVCNTRVEDSAIQIYAPEDKQTPLRGKPTGKPQAVPPPQQPVATTPKTMTDLEKLEAAQRFIREVWEAERTGQDYKDLDMALVFVGRVIKRRSQPKDSLSGPAERKKDNPFANRVGH